MDSQLSDDGQLGSYAVESNQTFQGMRILEWVGATLSPLNCLNEEFISADPELYKNPMLLSSRGLLRARSRFPEIVENIRNAKQRMKDLESGLVLAKQVLSQLSYTPAVGSTSF
jgi:hypothetical protein